ncbi:MAG: hypothetical protein IKM25_07870, partial [Clostridia bacterium]|nr:hypothetical protein [Clostridia bacterium]
YVGSNVQTIEWGNFYETVYDPETEYKNETRYEIYYDGTEKQWNEIFEDKYEREEIDKTKVIYLK